MWRSRRSEPYTPGRLIGPFPPTDNRDDTHPTMNISWVDWVIAVLTILVCFVPALFLAKRSGKSTSEFFASGRSVPWWLAGLSMVATTFSSDTPNWVTEQVRRYGVAGNWQWWAFVLTGVATVFFFARLWRRSGVLTDLEFYELRYSGKSASVVRGFRAVYLGLFFNCFIMATVNLAAVKIANVVLGWPEWQTLLVCAIMTIFFASVSGLWGVMVTDSLQFVITMSGTFVLAYYSLSHPAIGSVGTLIVKRGGRLNVNGTRTAPVVFTSDQPTGSRARTAG